VEGTEEEMAEMKAMEALAAAAKDNAAAAKA
jgi:hypothetical protein